MSTKPSAGSQLSPEELRRYSRHLLLSEVGLAGQKKLKGARVLLVGAGGLGSPLALYLAAAGVGTLGIADFDRVDATNLQRQVLFSTADIGASKTEIAARRIRALNPGVEVEPHDGRANEVNVDELVAAYDLVADGSDNFATRYLINDSCVRVGRPDVWGAVERFEGQVSIFAHPQGPCYRCLFPEPPPPELIPTCSEAGVLGVVPGVIGSLQATEVLKLILGIGDALIGRLLLFDALSMRFREVRVERDPACPVCSRTKSAAANVGRGGDRDTHEGESTGEADLAFDLAPAAARQMLAEGLAELVDVRLPPEQEIAAIAGARSLPLNELGERFRELPRDRDLIVFCHVGARSTFAVEWLRSHGFDRAHNLAGGIDAWSREVDPTIPRY